MKKLQLNKETIARLNNPERIMGGDPLTKAETCQGANCVTYNQNTCGASCENQCPTFVNEQTCSPNPMEGCASEKCRIDL